MKQQRKQGTQKREEKGKGIPGMAGGSAEAPSRRGKQQPAPGRRDREGRPAGPQGGRQERQEAAGTESGMEEEEPNQGPGGEAGDERPA